MLIAAEATQADTVDHHKLRTALRPAAGAQWRLHGLCYVQRADVNAQLTDARIAGPNRVKIVGGRVGGHATHYRSFQRRRLIEGQFPDATDARRKATQTGRGAVAPTTLATTVTGADFVVDTGA